MNVINKLENIEITTLGTSMLRAIKKYPYKPIIIENNKHTTMIELLRESIAFIQYIDSIQFDSSKTITLMAKNTKLWRVIVLGCILKGITYSGIFPSTTEDNVNHCIRISNTDLFIIDDDSKLYKNVTRVVNINKLKKTIKEIKTNISDKEIFKFISEYKSKPYDKNVCILFTSGTTGPPKGVILNHLNFSVSLNNIYKKTKNKLSREERILSYLPLSHIAGQITDIYIPILIGGSIYISSPDNLKNDLPKVQPTIMNGVPLVWNRIKANIEERVGNFGTIIKKTILKRAGIYHLKLGINMGAPLGLDTYKFFKKYSRPITNCYGTTETCGPVTFSDDYEKGLGKPLVPIKIIEDEIIIRSDQIAKNIIDGDIILEIDTQNYKSGDLGFFDKNKNLFLSGRKKEIIITDAGENINYIDIESKLKQDPDVVDCIVIGNKRKFLSVIFFSIKTNFDKLIESANSKAPNKAHKIRKYIVIKNAPTIQNNLITPSFKLKRENILLRYKKEIDSMYN